MDLSFLEWAEDEPLDIDPRFFYEEEDSYEISDEEGETVFTMQEIVKYCLKPTLFDGLHHVGRILLWCFMFRISFLLSGLSEKLVHLLSISTGIYLLFLMFNSVWYYMVIASVIGYLILKIANIFAPGSQGYITFFTVIALLLPCEFLLSPHEWHSIRGCQMLIAMRIISLSFDCGSSKSTLPDPVSILSYLLCPGTVIFGPWISYQDFNANLKNSSISAQWLCKIIISVTLGLFFLSISTCWAQYFIPQGSWKWSIAYRDALSFRSSHYFVSYISEASSALAGVSLGKLWGDSVTKPHYIEVPRSLVEIVIYWNMPLHRWFKHYVFKPAQPCGNGVAVIITYLVSAILHGVNFQLSAVLLSLGYYTYIEHNIRQKLANIFNACVGARICRKCDHTYQSSHPAVIVTNLFLSSLTLFHLTYLGLMFDSQSTVEDTGYDMSHTLNKWKHLGFASHWVILITHILHCII